MTGSRETSPVPPPGFRPFEWPEAKWIKNGELQRDPGLKFVASWSAKIAEEEMSSPPPLETLSPIPMVNSQDSMTVQAGTTDSEAVTPIVLDRIRSVHRRRSRRPSRLHTTIVKPAPVEDFCLGTFCVKRPRLTSGRYQLRRVIETVTRCLDGG